MIKFSTIVCIIVLESFFALKAHSEETWLLNCTNWFSLNGREKTAYLYGFIEGTTYAVNNFTSLDFKTDDARKKSIESLAKRAEHGFFNIEYKTLYKGLEIFCNEEKNKTANIPDALHTVKKQIQPGR